MSNIRKTIVLVDDNVSNLTTGRNMLKTFYQVIPVASARDMFETLKEVTPDLILLDIEMPEMSGYEAIVELKADERLKDIPVIFLTAKDDSDSELEGLDLGAVDYVTKPFSAPLLLKRIEKELLFVNQKRELVETQIYLKTHLANLEAEVKKEAETILQLHSAVLDTVVDLVEIRDNYTGGHIVRTKGYIKILLDEMQNQGVYVDEISDWDVSSILAAAKLHDVGKIAVSDAILGKPSKLTEEEYEIMKNHVTAGVDAIERIIKKTGEDSFYHHAIRMTGTHHEKWNGTGYPIGLRGSNIPLEGRLMAIADVYDALISERHYKPAIPHEEACGIIEDGAGIHFDPALIEIFKNVKDKFEYIAETEK